MGKGEHLGEFEQMVILANLRLGDDSSRRHFGVESTGEFALVPARDMMGRIWSGVRLATDGDQSK